MTAGAALSAAAAALALIVLANYIEWENAADALGTLALLTLPPLVGGLVVLVFGRFVYGEWMERAPVRRIVALLAQIAGGLLAAAMSVMFLILLLAGIEEEDRRAMIALGIGMTVGFTVFFAGWLLKPARGAKFIG